MSRHNKQLQLNLFSQNAFSENRTDSILTSACNRRLTIIFIIVCSSKLGDANVGRMYNAIEEFIEEIRRISKKKELCISIDTLFNTETVYWQSDCAIRLDQYECFSPEPGGEFKPSEVFTALIQRLSAYETDAYAPIFYLIGGNLHPNITNAKYRELQNQALFQNAIRNSFPLKDEVSDFYQSFASAPEHILTELTPECLKTGIVTKSHQIQAESTQKQTTTAELSKDAEQKIKKFEALYEDSKIQYLELYNKFQSITDELKATKDNYENIKTELKDSNKQATEWQLASSKWKSAYDTLIQVSKSEIVKLKNDLNDSNTQIDALRDDNQRLQSDLKAVKDNYKKLQNDLSESNTHVDALRNDNQRLQSDLKIAKKNYKKLQNDLNDSNTHVDALRNDNRRLQEDKDSLQCKLHSANSDINDLKTKIKKQDTEYSNKIDVLNSEKNNILARYNILENRNHEYQSRFKFITTSIIFIALLTICIFIIDNHKISERDKTIETLTLENQTQMNDLQKQRDELFAQQKALQSSQKAELLLPSENSPSSNNCSYNKSEIDISLTVAHDVIYERIKKATHTSGILSGKLIIGINSVSWITTKNTLTSKVSPTWLTQTIENSYKYPANCTGKPIEVTWVFKF